MSKMNIIKNPEALRSNYVPEQLLFRDELLTTINKKLSVGVGNLLLFGDTGCGKTITAKKAIEQQQNCVPVDINCARENTYASITKRIIETITHKPYNELGKNRGQLSEDLIKVLKTKRRNRLLFLFDEIDKLVDKEGDHQQILNPILETVNNNIVLISNKIEALNKLDPRLMSRLTPAREYVQKYNADEILQILKQRAEIALEQESYDIELLAKIAKWTYQTSGDIREALSCFFEAASVAETNSCKITSELFYKAKDTVQEVEFDKIFSNLTDHQKVIIIGISILSNKEIEHYAEHKELYNLYEASIRKKGNEPVGIRQFENYLRKLELMNLTQISNKSAKKRRGKIVVSCPVFDVQRFIDKYDLEPQINE